MPQDLEQYNQGFYNQQANESYKTAKNVLELIFEKIMLPKSVLDIGCGVGSWLKAATELGANDIFGIDGSDLAKINLFIDSDRFEQRDLTKFTHLNRQFDMAISLEVAEHISSDKHHAYIKTICSHSETILFSAAIPYQGGTGHVSENWPQYWKTQFSAHGYECFDIIRPIIWDAKGISFWYKQNILMFAKGKAASLLKERGYSPATNVLALVHPEMYLWAMQRDKKLSKDVYARDLAYYFQVKDNVQKSIEFPIAYGEEYNCVY